MALAAGGLLSAGVAAWVDSPETTLALFILSAVLIGAWIASEVNDE